MHYYCQQCALTTQWVCKTNHCVLPLKTDATDPCPMVGKRRLQLFTAILLFRLLNAFSIKTFFQPDEFYQAWEPVYPGGYLTWEWTLGIRTSLVPQIFKLIINLSRAVGCNHLILGKVVMAFVAASADLASASVVSRLAGQGTFSKGLALSVGSGFNWMCSTRPFSNTFEYTLVAIATALWPLKPASFRWPKFLAANVLAQISIALRPSNGLYWVMFGGYLLWVNRNSGWIPIVLVAGVIGAVTQSAILIIDMSWYNRTVWPFWAFLSTNFGDNVSELYGVMPWHYYVSQAVPILLLGYTPLTLIGLYRTNWDTLFVLLVIFGNILAFSLVAHKELRFVYFLLPCLHSIAARSRVKNWWRWFSVLLAVNIIFGGYFGTVHQRGVMDVLTVLKDDPELSEVSFLMPCHSTPWSSHFQRPEVVARALTCDPPYFVSNKANYVDEADRFYLDPVKFLAQNPEYITQTVVAFESLDFPSIARQLGVQYTPQQHIFNSHFHDDWRRRGDVIIYHLLPSHAAVV